MHSSALKPDRRGARLRFDQFELDEAEARLTCAGESVHKSAISDARAALGDDPKEPRYIETVSRRGYRFIAVALDAP